MRRDEARARHPWDDDAYTPIMEQMRSAYNRLRDSGGVEPVEVAAAPDVYRAALSCDVTFQWGDPVRVAPVRFKGATVVLCPDLPAGTFVMR